MSPLSTAQVLARSFISRSVSSSHLHVDHLSLEVQSIELFNRSFGFFLVRQSHKGESPDLADEYQLLSEWLFGEADGLDGSDLSEQLSKVCLGALEVEFVDIQDSSVVLLSLS